MKRFKQNQHLSNTKNVKLVSKNIDIQTINPNCAGIDIGSRAHFVAIPPDRADPVKEFPSTTKSLQGMCKWLKKNKITTVAMESTGSYWIPVYEILESHGIEVYLVNAKSVKNVPGRKTDVIDCQWIQKLHSVGFLTKSFRPKDHCLKLRSLARQHSSLIEHRSPHVQHMQKALHEMNIQLATHIRDITGLTGMRIIDAILAGERDEEKFAELVDPRCKKGAKAIAESLLGNYREEHLFTLKQSRDLYYYYTKLVLECEQEIEKALKELTPQADKSSEAKEIEQSRTDKLSIQTFLKKKRRKPNHFQFPLAGILENICGIAVTDLPGIDQSTALKIIAELGGNVDAWANSKRFASWLGLCPGNKISGGKSLSGKTKRCQNKVANLLRMAANGLWNAKCYLGAFLRRMRNRLGGPKAITATAHKLAVILYTMIKEKKPYQELGEEYYEKTYRERRLKGLLRQANEMGFELIEKAA